jgi:hypothetical protein
MRTLIWLLLLLVPAAAQPLVPATMITVPINVPSATTTQLVPAAPGRFIYVAHWDAIAGAATNLTWVAGTGTNCATGQVPLAGPYPLGAGGGISSGSGYGAVIAVPVGQALCLTSSAAGAVGGALGYALF